MANVAKTDAEKAAAKAAREAAKLAKFIELANKRVPKALDAIAALRGLGNKNNYTAPDGAVDKIAAALEAEVVKTVKALRGEATEAAGFQLTAPTA